ncbi:Ger(x)C family spore germination protein [Paenibacillus humicola]|uniref:Ger(x)C family spore germination protein n=1 Tax=Paenibacillus humicola TaxID=3110540 RepID=UPI00237B4735|nr:Ger(x)C family spore germination protein [Paenibacillus humicola]
MRNAVRLTVIAAVTLLLGGCWNMRESNNTDYAMAVGIDLNERGEVALTIQSPVLEAIKPQSQATEDTIKSLSTSGKTAFEAVRSYVEIMGVKVFWSHLKVLVISEDAARKGVDSYLDFFLSDPEMRNTAYVAIVKGRAKDLLESEPDITSIPANLLSNQLENANINSFAPSVRFNEFARSLTNPEGWQPFAPVVKRYEQSEYDRNIVGIAPYQGGDSQQSNLFLVEGTAVFKGTRMIGTMNKTETRGLLWVINKVKSATVRVPCREEAADCRITLEVSGKPSAKYTVDYDDKRPVIRIHIKTNVNIADGSNQTAFIDDKYIRDLEHRFADTVHAEIMAAFNKAAKTYRTDVFGFGNRLEDDHYRLWTKLRDRWDQELLPQARLDIQIDVKIRRRGRMLYSPWTKE